MKGVQLRLAEDHNFFSKLFLQMSIVTRFNGKLQKLSSTLWFLEVSYELTEKDRKYFQMLVKQKLLVQVSYRR